MTKLSERVRSLVAEQQDKPQATSEQRSRAWRLKIITSSTANIPSEQLCDLLLDELEAILTILNANTKESTASD